MIELVVEVLAEIVGHDDPVLAIGRIGGLAEFGLGPRIAVLVHLDIATTTAAGVVGRLLHCGTRATRRNHGAIAIKRSLVMRVHIVYKSLDVFVWQGRSMRTGRSH